MVNVKGFKHCADSVWGRQDSPT
ncbi:protein of unknown function [Candidatus Methylocalor cossyra]|uniref:Uncharacterized protein n=1 Tax=Candidatus Methylocalor cossyra TaxID=3108543 RepID=A0ABM9NIH2_9GAMM